MRFLFALILVSLQAALANAAGSSSMSADTINNRNKTNQIGVGIAVGSLNGVVGQYWLSSDRAVNATFAAERGNGAVALAHNWYFRNAFADGGEVATYLVPYVGVGALVVFGTQSDVMTRNTENVASAVQVPIGIDLLPLRQRFDLFAELVPSMELSPTAVGFLAGDLGAKFSF